MTRKELNLRLRKWVELLKDCDLIIDYHPGIANMVKSLFALKALNTRLTLERGGFILIELRQIFELQKNNSKLKLKHDLIKNGQTIKFSIDDDSKLYFRGLLCVPNDTTLKRDILSEAHSSAYLIQHGSTKMYRDLKQIYWWPGMKQEISEFVTKCLVCQQVKVKHQRWERVTVVFVSGLLLTPKKKYVIWVIIDRLTKSTHFIPVIRDYSLKRSVELYISEII
ncbi:DNA/RNA polymerases superfamily protein [Gossypium australe]|uniref:DNA/RNA polymerases superfamily protein n=1 Tax=Gossypium australe TaxID=47621 RepID=A0A5B6WPA8_9ROSI|nr:DNA/RNA polymerases superfamily protein [Gossypium australe]